ncbi:MAG TPA: aldo/keto reductase [Candidatus Limnocylindrales bacterium]|nr:aldo/keto reductase [Candidatus Limnocylindrales bacterium]
MDFRNIGSLKVSAIGLGCNNFGWRVDARATAETVDAAIAHGINFFDTADIYGGGQSEEYLGRALGARRKDVIVATKFGMKMDEARQGAHPDYVKRAASDSLRRLGTEYIDLYQLHQPDPKTPIGDTLGALDELVREGKVREIGCSNFSVEQLREAERASGGRVRFVSVQNQYSLMHRDPEQGVLAECERAGIAFLPFFPLASGLLTGKYRPGAEPPPGSRAASGWGPKVFTPEHVAAAERLRQFAEGSGHTLLDLAFSWLLSKPAVASVIAGAKSADQVTGNASMGTWQLTPNELAEVDRILAG